jgi:hypothetical protein
VSLRVAADRGRYHRRGSPVGFETVEATGGRESAAPETGGRFWQIDAEMLLHLIHHAPTKHEPCPETASGVAASIADLSLDLPTIPIQPVSPDEADEGVAETRVRDG